MVIDINGYFAPAGAGGLSLYTLTPCRLLDTRQGGAQPFSGTLNVNVTAFGCSVPTTAQAYVFNATVVPPSSLGYLTLWPEGAPLPVVSTLNALDGSITSNMAIVPTSNGSISAFAAAPTQLILDISGYFAPSSIPPGAFATTGSMTTPRRYHAATLLPNGTVLVVGGTGGAGATGTLSSAEIYNPATNTFSATGSMTTARAEPVSTLLADGTVMVAGGFASDGTGLNSAEIYNPATGIFTPIATGFYSEFVSTLTLLPNGKVLGTGAGGAIGEVYNPATGTFSATGNLLAPSLQFDTATLLPNGTVLVAGGDDLSPDLVGGGPGTLASAEIYNPATGSFTATGSMTTPREADTATLLPNGKVLLVGGDESGTAELYQP
jgi:hypothetical protein